MVAAAALLAAGLSDAQPAMAVRGSDNSTGTARVFAHVPPPGYPALTLVTPDQKTVYVSTFTGVNGGTPGPSKVFAYSARGKLRHTYVLRGQTRGASNHAVQVAARDRQGRLYLLDQTPPRIVRLDPRTGRQRTWATFADVPTCAAANRPANCSNSAVDNPPEPDYAAWLPDGSMLVTDYAQQLIWHVGRRGGKAHVWLNDARLDGEMFGPAGILLAPNHRAVYLTVSAGPISTSGGSQDNASSGNLYRIRIDSAGHPVKLSEVWSSGAAEAPDGFALSRSGHIFVALSGPSGNAVAELAQQGGGSFHVVRRIPSSTAAGESSSPPWDTPTSVQFLGRSILVTNQGYFTGTTSHMVVFRVLVGQRGERIFVPSRP